MNDKESITEKLKEVELDILKAFIEVCEKLNLKYYALGGTMLGAVRHHGFIPWDDDIDVGMLRKDYEIFMEKGQELLPEHLFLQNRKTDSECPVPYAKIRDSRTAFIETVYKYKKMNHGIFIDIFPLDYYPDNDSEGKRLFGKKKRIAYRMYREYNIPGETKSPPVKEFVKNFVSTALIAVYPSGYKAEDKFDEKLKSLKKSRRVTNYYGVWSKKEIVPCEWYGDGCNGVFEGIIIKLPSQYDKLLTQIFGDYMEYPPVEERITHHYTEVIDPCNSYLKYAVLP